MHAIPDIGDTVALADWVELHSLGSRGFLSVVALRRSIATMTENESEDIEVSLNLLAEEMRRRQRICGQGYPFRFDTINLRIEVVDSPNKELYRFLLYVSLGHKVLDPAQKRAASTIFDEMATEATKRYLGSGTETFPFSWPPVNGRPGKFDEALELLSARVGLPRGVGKPSVHTNDGGVDLVAWKSFPDNREAFLFALAQFTIQQDWVPKGKDIIANVWLSRIDSGVPAVVILAIPHLVPVDFPKWDDVRRMVTVVFERFRISFHLAIGYIPSESLVQWNRSVAQLFSVTF